MAQATVTKTVRLPERLARKMEQAAKNSHYSENGLMIRAINDYLAEFAKEEKA